LTPLTFALCHDLDPVPCGADEYQCFNWQCIRASFYCDGDDDCGDRSDEPSWCGQSMSLHNISLCLSSICWGVVNILRLM